MESFWATIAHELTEYRSRIAYPSISTIPEIIASAPIELDQIDFTQCGVRSVIEQCAYLRLHRIKKIYLTDQATWHWRYAVFRLCGVQSIIVHDHTPGVRTIPSGPKRWVKWLLQRLPLHTCDAVLAVSEYIRQRAIDVACVPTSRCHTVQNGIPHYEPSLVDPYSLFNIPRDRKIIVTVSRASKYKGIHDALGYLAALHHSDWHYLFIGDGPDLEEFKALADNLGIPDRVTFAGRRSDVKDLLPHCYAGIHPSNGEAFSLAILELMQAGLPMIVPNNPSVCGATSSETGLIYGSSTEAIAALRELLDNENTAQEMGRAAQQLVKEKFSLANTHRALISAMS